MGRQSFSDAVRERPQDFVKYAFEKNPNIKDFGDFDDAFREAFDTPNGANANIDTEDIIALFESSVCKNKLKERLSDNEIDRLYGDGIIVERETTSRKNQVVTITGEKVPVSSHIWKGKQIKPYNKLKPRPFSNAEVRFIQVRKQKGTKPSRIIKDYNAHFSKNPRTSSSIRTKSYRIK